MVVTCGDNEVEDEEEEEEDNDDEDDGDDKHDDGILRKLLRQTNGTTKLEIEPVSQDERCPLRTLEKELSTQPHSPSKTRWLRLSRTLKSTLHLATWKGTEVGLAVSWCHWVLLKLESNFEREGIAIKWELFCQLFD